jgi:hypothetical protein
MPITIDVQILGDQASGILKKLQSDSLARDVNKVAGRDVVNLLKKHFSRLDQTRANALGGRRTHFYAQVSRSVRQDLQGNAVKVSAVHVGIAQRYFGGTILPKNSRWLTIPVNSVAYGKRAREFDLRYQPTKNNRSAGSKPVLVDNASDQIFYVLVKKVVQQADPSVLPTENEIRETAINRAIKYLNRITQQEGGS